MRKLLFIYLLPLLFFSSYVIAETEWTMVVYMQGDNNLSSMVDRDMAEMVSGLASASIDPSHPVNIVTQVDYPVDKKTWRFVITPSGKIERGSVFSEMGINPVEELVETGRWIKRECPAKKYAFILWNHGSGVEDYKSIFLNSRIHFNGIWMNIFKDNVEIKDANKISFNNKNYKRGLGKNAKSLRGILYDDSEGTCLTNQGLSSAFTKIMNILGQPIDLLAMDACLMSMVEIAYQVKNCVKVLVGSQETEPGTGFFYTAITSALASNPVKIGPMNLASIIIESYNDFYSHTAVKNYTLSAINMDFIEVLKNNIDQVASNLIECMGYKPVDVRKALSTARNSTLHFENNSYIDLFAFYQNLNVEVAKLIAKAETEPSGCFGLCKTSKNYLPALTRLSQFLNDGLILIPKVVFANVNGTESRDAHGISIYYPSSILSIHPSYVNTLFAQQSQWFKLIKKI